MSQAEVDAANKLIIDSITKYKVIIAGCRDFADYELLKEECDFYLQNQIAGRYRDCLRSCQWC